LQLNIIELNVVVDLPLQLKLIVSGPKAKRSTLTDYIAITYMEVFCMLSLTTKDGMSSPLFDISWPVFTNYSILPLKDYINFMENTKGIVLSIAAQKQLESKRENFDNTFVIFPTSNEIKRLYNPLTNTPNAFIDLSKIPNSKKLQSKILKWVNKHGLPYHGVKVTTSNAVVDDVHNHGSDIESLLVEQFGEYAMLQETFLALAFEANRVTQVFRSLSGTIDESTLYPLTAIIDREKPIDVSSYSSRSEVNAHIEEELISLLQKRMNGYSRQVVLSLGASQATNKLRSRFTMRFDIPDLLTALWYQFYTLLTDSTNLKVCKECNKLFISTRANHQYCPPLGKTTISPCRSKYNQRNFRKKTVDTQPE